MSSRMVSVYDLISLVACGKSCDLLWRFPSKGNNLRIVSFYGLQQLVGLVEKGNHKISSIRTTRLQLLIAAMLLTSVFEC